MSFYLLERIFWAVWMLVLAIVFTPLGPAIGNRWACRSLWKWKLVPQRRADGTMDYNAPPIMRRWHILRAVVTWRGRQYGREFAFHFLMNADNLALGLHDHPWDFWSIVLRGWYVEMYHDRQVDDEGRIYVGGQRRRPWLSSASHPATFTHAIIDVAPRGCLTFVVTSPRIQAWGFPDRGIVIG